jgi:hypothetical protein
MIARIPNPLILDNIDRIFGLTDDLGQFLNKGSAGKWRDDRVLILAHQPHWKAICFHIVKLAKKFETYLDMKRGTTHTFKTNSLL